MEESSDGGFGAAAVLGVFVAGLFVGVVFSGLYLSDVLGAGDADVATSIDELSDSFSALEDSFASLSSSVEGLSTGLDELGSDLSSHDTDVRDLIDSRLAALAADVNDIGAEIENINSELNALRADLGDVESLLAGHDSDIRERLDENLVLKTVTLGSDVPINDDEADDILRIRVGCTDEAQLKSLFIATTDPQTDADGVGGQEDLDMSMQTVSQARGLVIEAGFWVDAPSVDFGAALGTPVEEFSLIPSEWSAGFNDLTGIYFNFYITVDESDGDETLDSGTKAVLEVAQDATCTLEAFP